MIRRQASVTLEAIIAIPILFIATVALVQFFVTAIVQQTAVHAATRGAQVAALANSDMDDVQYEVDLILHSVNLAIGPNASVVRQTSGSTTVRGAYPCTPPAAPPLNLDEVRVTVCIDMTTNPLINSLMVFGVDLSGKTMTTTSQTFRE